MKNNILSKIKPIEDKKSTIVKEATRKALIRLYPHIKVSEEKLENIVSRMHKQAWIDPIPEPLLKRIAKTEAAQHLIAVPSGMKKMLWDESNNYNTAKRVLSRLYDRIKNRLKGFAGDVVEPRGELLFSGNLGEGHITSVPKSLHKTIAKKPSSAELEYYKSLTSGKHYKKPAKHDYFEPGARKAPNAAVPKHDIIDIKPPTTFSDITDPTY